LTFERIQAQEKGNRCLAFGSHLLIELE